MAVPPKTEAQLMSMRGKSRSERGRSRSQSPLYPCPAPLDNGNEGSGNEIGKRVIETHNSEREGFTVLRMSMNQNTFSPLLAMTHA